MRVGIEKPAEPILRDQLDKLLAPILDLLGVDDAKDLLSVNVQHNVVTSRVMARTNRGKLLPDTVVRLSVRVVDE